MSQQNKIGLIITYQTKIDLSQFANDNYFLVGVEQGCLAIMKQKINLDLAISDFDHVSPTEFKAIEHYAQKMVVLNPEKDELDGNSAINYLHQLGIKKIKFFVKPTKRIDMNLSIMDLMKNYDDLEIINEDSLVIKIKSGKTELPYQLAKYVSFYTLSDNNWITLRNFKYETWQLKADLFSTRFLSNEFLENQPGLIENKEDVVMIISR